MIHCFQRPRKVRAVGGRPAIDTGSTASLRYNVGLSGAVTHPAGKLDDKFVLRFFFLILVDEVHQRPIHGLELIIVVDGDQNLLAVFLHRLQNADLKLFSFIGLGGNERKIAAALIFQLCQNLQLILLAVFIGDGDKIASGSFRSLSRPPQDLFLHLF